MSKHTAHANSQSVSAQMARGNASQVARIKALLRDHAPKPHHHFCPPLRTQADADKSRAIHKSL